ncbi:unnamed protein product [Cuscuta campestris]|uniref:Thiaminase-2/PQQC domain-containing protein n=1 Tax=Cuscuta campestris TaxID=132261 RepID=A0A484N3I6_9ASTE|nr:unnamed protein product [Cuscuta campestris]
MGGWVIESTDEGGIARKLWKKFKDETVFALYTPFVVGLGSSTLDSRTFLQCVSQDVYFLQAFSKAYEFAEEYADDDEDKEAIGMLRKRVLRRLGDQHNLVRDWGFELPKDSTCVTATVKYTDFLMATAVGKVDGEKFPGKIVTPFEKTKLAAYTLSAIAPCMRLYHFVSREIKAILDPQEKTNPYEKWIDSLSSDKFEVAALTIEDLLDKLCISLTSGELEIVEKLYHQSLKLILEFISSHPYVHSSSIVPIVSQLQEPAESNVRMFCDFDMTCSAIDSSALLAEMAIFAARKASLNECDTQPSQPITPNLAATWGSLSSKYIEEYGQCIESILPTEAVANFDYDRLCKALQNLSDFEKTANSMVIDSGVLKGLSENDIKRAGERLIFQRGCKNFFQEITRSENLLMGVHVLSYCWSGDLIRSAFSSGKPDVVSVHSNELVYEESITSGEMIQKMESPMDKLEAFNGILDNHGNESKPLTVYIGGSVSDLLCLLSADIGIVIGMSDMLRTLGEGFGVTFAPLFPGLVKKQRQLSECGCCNWNRMSGILFTVSSWAEIHAALLGKRTIPPSPI